MGATTNLERGFPLKSAISNALQNLMLSGISGMSADRKTFGGEVEEPAEEMTDADVQGGPGEPSEGEHTLENPAAEPPVEAQRGTAALAHNVSTRHPPPPHRMSAYMEEIGRAHV